MYELLGYRFKSKELLIASKSFVIEWPTLMISLESNSTLIKSIKALLLLSYIQSSMKVSLKVAICKMASLFMSKGLNVS